MGESDLLSPVCLWLKAPQRGEITEKQITNPDCIVGNAVPEEEDYMDNISKHYLFPPLFCLFLAAHKSAECSFKHI